MNFAELNLSSNINKAIAELGFTKATDIQAEAIPFLMDYPHDFIGQAQTGTGKTAAFVIPLLEKIDEDKKNIQAIVLAPTRELAQQVEKQIYLLTKFMKIKSMTVYGGVSYDKQIGNLKKLKPQIVVATPGRFIDLMDRGVLKLSSADTLVIDEADEMLNMGFLEDVEKIIDSLPKKRQVWMFSATMPNEIKRLIEQTFNAPEMIKVKSETLSNANIDQRFCVLQRRDFLKGLRLVLGSNPDAYGIVFCETRAETTKVAEILDGYGIKANALNGDLSQAARDRALERFRDKKVKLLICTDVAARGIDISNITHVFNMGLPRQKEFYVHRIGRTGRAGQKGMAISFITPSDMRELKYVERLTKQKLTEYKLPKSNELKEVMVNSELTKMDGLKEAMIKLQDEFKVDQSFVLYENFFKGLTKDQILKLMFSYNFKKSMRELEETLSMSQRTPKSGAGREKTRRDRRGRPSRGGERRDGRLKPRKSQRRSRR